MSRESRDAAKIDARCACGSVALEFAAEPLAHIYCHCDDCQHAHGAAYVPRAIFAKDAVSVRSGEVRKWVHGVRDMVMCSACGSHLYSEREGSPVRGVNASLLPPGEFKPIAHIHCRFAVAPVLDDLVHYLDLPAEFGGSGQTADW